MSKDTSQLGYHTVEDYNRLLGEGQCASSYVDQHGKDIYNQPRSTLTEADTKNIGMRKFQTGERDLDFGYHGVSDYNKILGEGQDDYAEGDYMNLFQKQQELKHKEGQKQQYPPTHLYRKYEANNYPAMDSQQYQQETYDKEQGNIESNVQIPGCGQANPREKQHHYVSNQFQPTVMLQARKMDDSHIPVGSVDTSCPGFEGKGHHTPIPGAGQMSSQPGYHHINPFHLVKNSTTDNNNSKNMDSEYAYKRNASGEEAIPRTMKQEHVTNAQGNTTTPSHVETPHHQSLFSRLKKTISR